MKASTLQKRIESKLTLKDGKTIAKCYSEVVDFIVYNKKSHPYYYSGSGRFCKCAGVDYISTALRFLGIDYETGNDAPRGGYSGYFVKLTKKGIEQTKEFRKEKLASYKEFEQAQEAQALAEKQNFDLRVSEISKLISEDLDLQSFISRKRAEGNKDRKIAWKLTSETRKPNLHGYSISEIISAL